MGSALVVAADNGIQRYTRGMLHPYHLRVGKHCRHHSRGAYTPPLLSSTLHSVGDTRWVVPVSQ